MPGETGCSAALGSAALGSGALGLSALGSGADGEAAAVGAASVRATGNFTTVASVATTQPTNTNRLE
jgi:hypothetical protein